jgi:hypothetical protein
LFSPPREGLLAGERTERSGVKRFGTALLAFAGLLWVAEAQAAPKRAAYASCGDAEPRYVRAAQENAQTLDTLKWAPFGVPETGWETYAPLTAREIGTTCGFGTPAFAEKLAAFQARFDLEPDGRFTPATFEVLKGVWQERRLFIRHRMRDECPDAPHPDRLDAIRLEEETFAREGRSARADALNAWRRMLAEARRQVASVRADPKALTIFSGWRDPAADEARCEADGGCDGARRARCSAHRTGTALDLNVGWAPGHTADGTSPENRLHQTRTEAYRWLVNNADRFGFVPYVFEPWHWEWQGSPDAPTASLSTGLTRLD